jgi:hypothetical protein
LATAAFGGVWVMVGGGLDVVCGFCWTSLMDIRGEPLSVGVKGASAVLIGVGLILF